MASMVASLDWLRFMIEPKRGEERADELTIKIDGERVGRLTHIIREERVDGLTFKIDEERVDGWSAKNGEERADGWTYRKVVEQMLVDGDGSESGGCNLAQVTPSTELQECVIRKWEELMTWGGDGGADGGGVDGVEWWRRVVITGVFDTEGTDVEVPLCPPVVSLARTG